jgi:transposase
MAYDKKYRIRAVEYRKEGNTRATTAKIFKVGTTTLQRWEKLYDAKNGKIEFDKPKRKHKKISDEKLQEHIENHPDDYLEEIAVAFCCSAEAVRLRLKN